MPAEINIRKAILQYRNPDIFLDELSVIDTSSQKGDLGLNDEKSGNVQKKYFGSVSPLVRINTEIISGLQYFKLDLTGFKPKLLFRFETIEHLTSILSQYDFEIVYHETVARSYNQEKETFEHLVIEAVKK